jgi:hypothetical protein
MKLSNLFIFNAVVALPFGLGFLLAPGLMASLYQVETSPSANLVGQFFGVSLIAIGLVTWLARYVTDADAEKAIVLGLMISDVLGLIVALMGMVNGVLNALGWLSVAIYLVLSAGYAYFYFGKLRKA